MCNHLVALNVYSFQMLKVLHEKMHRNLLVALSSLILSLEDRRYIGIWHEAFRQVFRIAADSSCVWIIGRVLILPGVDPRARVVRPVVAAAVVDTEGCVLGVVLALICFSCSPWDLCVLMIPVSLAWGTYAAFTPTLVALEYAHAPTEVLCLSHRAALEFHIFILWHQGLLVSASLFMVIEVCLACLVIGDKSTAELIFSWI